MLSPTFLSTSGLKRDDAGKVESKPAEWANLIGKLVSDGRTFSDVKKFTLKQAESVLAEQAEKFKNQARIAGCTFEDEDSEPREANSEDIALLLGMFGSK